MPDQPTSGLTPHSASLLSDQYPVLTEGELKRIPHDSMSLAIRSCNGFLDYNDATGAIPITASVWVDIPNDGGGVFTNSNYPPLDVDILLDTSSGYLDVSQLSLGDVILVRKDFIFNPDINNTVLSFRYILGSGSEEYILGSDIGKLDEGGGHDYQFTLSADMIYLGDNNTRNNPIKMQLSSSKDGTLTNTGVIIQTIRNR